MVVTSGVWQLAYTAPLVVGDLNVVKLYVQEHQLQLFGIRV